MMRTAVATLALSRRVGPPGDGSDGGKADRANREPSAEARRHVRQPVRLRLAEDLIGPETRELAVRHVALDAQPQGPADDAAAGLHRLAALDGDRRLLAGDEGVVHDPRLVEQNRVGWDHLEWA